MAEGLAVHGSRTFFVPLLAATLLATSALGQGTGGYKVEMLDAVDASAFPEVTVRFRILDANGQPAKTLPREDIVILEDGKEVHRMRPSRLKDVPTAVMLALDTSGSMDREGKMPEMKAAAKRFFQRLEPQAPCGLVLFHHEAYRAVAPNVDRQPLVRLIDEARPKGGTAYIDAVMASLEQLPKEEGEKRHAVVVMTDGRDVNSSHSLRAAIDAARQQKTPVYTVGLGSPSRGTYVRTALVLDRSGSMNEEGRMEALKQAATRYLLLLPGEAADTCVLAFSDRMNYALEERGFSSERRRLINAIAGLRANGGTHLYDALHEALEALDESRQRQQAGDRPLRLAVISLTDGMDQRSTKYRYDLDVIPYAKRLEIPIHMLGLGPSDGLNEPVMKEIAKETGGQYHHIRDPRQLTDVFESLSIDLHEGGIDEVSLQTLAKETGGDYFHVKDADKLQSAFDQIAAKVENTYAITFRSLRSQPDGTGRSLQIRLGQIAEAVAGYKTHGLITPKSDPFLYLAGLGLILLLLAVPALLRRTPAEVA